MDKFDRIFHMHAILSSRRTAIPSENLMARLECSKATLHRIIATMRTYLGAPIIVNSEGYRYADAGKSNTYELPELWFLPTELQALAQGSEHTLRRWQNDWSIWPGISD